MPRSRSPSPSSPRTVPGHPNTATLSISRDYFTKSSEFRSWLASYKSKSKDSKHADKGKGKEKGLSFERLTGEEARRYFKKFVRRWNEGELDDAYYSGTIQPPKSKHVWGFEGSLSKKEQQTLAEATQADDRPSTHLPSASTTRPTQGPLLPAGHSALSALHSSREAERDREASERAARAYEGKKRRREEREEEEEGRATGRDRRVEKRREMNASNRAFASRREEADGLGDVGEEELMGGAGDSFQAAVRERERARGKGRGKREREREEREAEKLDRFREMKTKEGKTMDMLRQLAESRFGKG
ncbi:hypothetical protein BT69DRAFT_1319658 [Atractiella rhizophila]|nr:hypothetical protein BT69DRAFT_1319658 [Atractiella rhizophila]